MRNYLALRALRERWMNTKKTKNTVEFHWRLRPTVCLSAKQTVAAPAILFCVLVNSVFFVSSSEIQREVGAHFGLHLCHQVDRPSLSLLLPSRLAIFILLLSTGVIYHRGGLNSVRDGCDCRTVNCVKLMEKVRE
jgi:hypothetical protein